MSNGIRRQMSRDGVSEGSLIEVTLVEYAGFDRGGTRIISHSLEPREDSEKKISGAVVELGKGFLGVELDESYMGRDPRERVDIENKAVESYKNI